MTANPYRGKHAVTPRNVRRKRTKGDTMRKRTIGRLAGLITVPTAAVLLAISSAPAQGTTAQIASQTHAAGFTHQFVWSFPGTTLAPQWGVYNSTATTSGGDSRNPNNVWVSGGALHLRASGDQGSGVCLCRGSGTPKTPYGRWDIYARVPVDAHHDFGILLWPNSGQPKAGEELDIAEFPGPDKTVLQNTVHDGPGTNKHSHFTNGTYSGWHKYSVVWSKSSLSFWVDDNLVWQADPSYSTYDAMHLVLQGGQYSPSTPNTGSSVMDVKSIRYFH